MKILIDKHNTIEQIKERYAFDYKICVRGNTVYLYPKPKTRFKYNHKYYVLLGGSKDRV